MLNSLQQYLPFTVLKQEMEIKVTEIWFMLQQYLPFTVLKRNMRLKIMWLKLKVATVLTVYGIETDFLYFETVPTNQFVLQQYLPFTVLKRPGDNKSFLWGNACRLQQYLPFTVLKQLYFLFVINTIIMLQQYLPFTVLKHPPAKPYTA